MSAAFIEAIARAMGSTPDPRKLLPGQIVRFSTNGRRGDDSGWCKLFADGCAGVFGNWRTGEQHVWHADRRPQDWRARMIASQTARLEEQAQRQARAVEAARLIWSRASACVAHQYLDRKGVQSDALRVQFANARECRNHFWTGSEPLRGLLLLVPMRDFVHGLQSLQAIDGAGNKSFLKGARTRGLFHVVGGGQLRDTGKPFDGHVGIAEGYATAASVSALEGWPCFVAFNAGNLLPVAQAVRQQFPRAALTVCGDNDPNGVGQAKADEAAAATGGQVAIPPFTLEEQLRGLTDWNDYAALLRSTREVPACRT